MRITHGNWNLLSWNAAALQAKIAPDRIINFLTLKALRQWVEQLRGLTD